MNEATKEALALEMTKAKFSKNEKLDATSSYDWIRIYNQSFKEIEHELKRNIPKARRSVARPIRGPI